MNISRRDFLGCSATVGTLALTSTLQANDSAQATFAELDRVAAQPVLRVELLTSPVIIKSVELLRNGHTFLVRVRSLDGAEGLSIPNASRLMDAYPIFLNRVAPFCAGTDARRWEQNLWELYRHKSNYKFQGLAFWV